MGMLAGRAIDIGISIDDLDLFFQTLRRHPGIYELLDAHGVGFGYIIVSILTKKLSYHVGMTIDNPTGQKWYWRRGFGFFFFCSLQEQILV